MPATQSLFAFGFITPPSLPKVVPKITRLDMGLILPRLDTPVVDESGNTDPAKKQGLEKLIEKYAAVYVLGGRIANTKLTKGKGDDPGVRFIGQFKALVNPVCANSSVGNYFVSGRAHVPKFYEEILYTQVLEGKEKDPSTLIDFLVGVGLKAPAVGKPSITGYEWTIEPLVDMSPADNPVDALFNRGKERIALPAPPIEGSATDVTGKHEAARSQRRAS